MRTVCGKWFRGNCNTHFMFSKSPPPILAVYGIKWKNILSSYHEWRNAW